MLISVLLSSRKTNAIQPPGIRNYEIANQRTYFGYLLLTPHPCWFQRASYALEGYIFASRVFCSFAVSLIAIAAEHIVPDSLPCRYTKIPFCRAIYAIAPAFPDLDCSKSIPYYPENHAYFIWSCGVQPIYPSFQLSTLSAKLRLQIGRH